MTRVPRIVFCEVSWLVKETLEPRRFVRLIERIVACDLAELTAERTDKALPGFF